MVVKTSSKSNKHMSGEHGFFSGTVKANPIIYPAHLWRLERSIFYLREQLTDMTRNRDHLNRKATVVQTQIYPRSLWRTWPRHPHNGYENVTVRSLRSMLCYKNECVRTVSNVIAGNPQDHPAALPVVWDYLTAVQLRANHFQLNPVKRRSCTVNMLKI